jgi:hypothetical protein
MAEKRLIDANALNVEDISCYYGSNCYIEDVQVWLDEQPTVDAVEVCRCKDCKHGEVDDPDFPDLHYCHCGHMWNDGEHFCADGERRTDG